MKKKNKICFARMELYCNRGGLATRRLENFIAIQLLYCRRRLENFVLQYTGLYCRGEGCGIVLQDGCIGLELYCNTVIVLQAGRLGWLAVLQYNRSVLWLGKGLLGESRYKICIVTEAASWLGDGLGVQQARGALSRRAGRSTGVRAGAGRRRRRVAGGAREARGAGKGGARWAWARWLAKAVHSVYSACFRPSLTRYCS